MKNLAIEPIKKSARIITNQEKILHHKFIEYGRNAKEWTQKCILLLPEIERLRIWERKGFGSIYEYATKLAGMSRNTVDDALRILRKIEDKPELQKVVEQRGINVIRPILTVATPENASFWAEKVNEMSRHTLEVYVRELKKDSRTGPGNNAKNSQQQGIENLEDAGLQQTKVIIPMELDPEIIQQLQKLRGQGTWNDLMRQFLKLREQKLEAQKPQPVETAKRHIPAKIKKYVVARTNGNCAYPGCTKPTIILHHTQRFALEKIHDPDQIQPLCKAHERLVHLGLVQNEERSPNFWQLRKNAEQNEPKYRIDKLVAKYRTLT